MKLSQAKVALRRYGFSDEDPLTAWLEQGKNDIEEAYNWPFLARVGVSHTNAGSNGLPMPSDLERIINAKNQNAPFNHLVERDYTGLVRDVLDLNQPGDPTVFYRVGSTFTYQVYPIPTVPGSYLVNYQSKLTDIQTLADTAELPGPARFHYAYVVGGAYYALQAESEEDRSDNALNLFNTMVSRLIRKYSPAPLGESATVIDVMGY